MKKLISIAVAVVMMMSFVLSAYAYGLSGYTANNKKGWQQTEDTRYSDDENDDEDDSIEATTPGSVKYYNELKDRIKQHNWNKKDRKALLKLLKDARKIRGIFNMPVFVDGDEVEFDVPPVIKSGRTLVPVRAITEALGAEVIWNSTKPNIITIIKEVNGVKITAVVDLTTGIITTYKNDVKDKEITLDVKPQLVHNRTVVPLRFFAEIFGMKVEWDGENGGVFVDQDKLPELLSAQAVSDTSVILTFSEPITNTLAAGDIVISDGAKSQNPVIASTTQASIVLTTTTLDGYEFGSTKITIPAGKIKDLDGNSNLAINKAVADKYAKAVATVTLLDSDNTIAGVTGADFRFIWTPAIDNTTYYKLYIFEAKDNIIFNANTMGNYKSVAKVLAGTNDKTLEVNYDSTTTDTIVSQLEAQGVYADGLSGYEVYVVSYDKAGNMAISAVGTSATTIQAP